MGVSPEQGLRAWIEYLRDMGIYDLYRRESTGLVLPEMVRQRLLSAASPVADSVRIVAPAPASQAVKPAANPLPIRLPTTSARADVSRTPPISITTSVPPAPAEPSRTYFSPEADSPQTLPPELAAPMPKPQPLESLFPAPMAPVPSAERQAALDRLRADIGDCTRCPLAYAGRHTIVFGEGDPNARLLFVGEGPGADEDATGRPFIGKAGQLLSNMISAMGLTREQVYISNIVKCRPPGNRTPEFVEATTCSQFLLRQIDIVRPEVIVALGATAATYVLGVRQPLASLRGQWFSARGAKVAVTYHPAFLLRDPRQKSEAWKDLQRVMAELGLKATPQQKS
ncbi:MAG: uracil-DNA glycosylase family protein [Janthinobacterium lividum]